MPANIARDGFKRNGAIAFLGFGHVVFGAPYLADSTAVEPCVMALSGH